MERKQVLGFAGSVILCLGVFAPVLLVPALGRVSYFIAGQGDASIVIALGLLSLYLSFKRKYTLLWYTGLGSLGVILFTFAGVHAAPALTPLTWGWAVPATGALAVTASAAIRPRAGKAVQREEAIPATM